MDLYEETKKLIGPIDPVGESHEDTIRLGNLNATINLVERLIDEIDDIATINSDDTNCPLKKIS